MDANASASDAAVAAAAAAATPSTATSAATSPRPAHGRVRSRSFTPASIIVTRSAAAGATRHSQPNSPAAHHSAPRTPTTPRTPSSGDPLRDAIGDLRSTPSKTVRRRAEEDRAIPVVSEGLEEWGSRSAANSDAPLPAQLQARLDSAASPADSLLVAATPSATVFASPPAPVVASAIPPATSSSQSTVPATNFSALPPLPPGTRVAAPAAASSTTARPLGSAAYKTMPAASPKHSQPSLVSIRPLVTTGPKLATPGHSHAPSFASFSRPASASLSFAPPSSSSLISGDWVDNELLGEHSRGASAIDGISFHSLPPRRSIDEQQSTVSEAEPSMSLAFSQHGQQPSLSLDLDAEPVKPPVRIHLSPRDKPKTPPLKPVAPPPDSVIDIKPAASDSVAATKTESGVPLSQAKQVLGPPSPIDQANFLSILLVWWATTLIVLGNKRPLDDADIPELPDDDRSSVVVAKFEKHFAKSREGGGKGSLWKSLFRAFGARWMWGGAMLAVSTVFQLLQPIFVQKLVLVLADSESADKWGYIWSAALIMTTLLSSIFLNQHFFNLTRSGNAARVACLTSVYDKALRLSNASRQAGSTGSTVNIMSNDTQRLFDCSLFLHFIWIAPGTIIVALALMVVEVGIAAVAGVVLLCLLSPFQIYISRRTGQNRREMLLYSDQRVKLMNEVLGGIRVVKLYAWERAIADKIEAIRQLELGKVKTALYLSALNQTTLFVTPAAVAAVIMCTYAALGNEVNVSNTFAILAYLNIIRNPTILIPLTINALAEAKVSSNRIHNFLTLDELPAKKRLPFDPSIPYSISVRDGVFLWSPNQTVPSLRDITLNIKPGSLVAIIGQVGSGKSSLISALLGEMLQVQRNEYSKLVPEEDAVLVNGTVAYVSQESWIRNDTVKGNILFGLPYDEHKYQTVLEAACLTHDITILPQGDATEIGEKGINLSGGQKSRLSIARSLYRHEQCDLYLMDDPFAAVDMTVGSHIFHRALQTLLAKKTRVIVLSSHLHLLEHCDAIVVMEQAPMSGKFDFKARTPPLPSDAASVGAHKAASLSPPSKPLLSAASSPSTPSPQLSPEALGARMAAMGTFSELKGKYWALMSQRSEEAQSEDEWDEMLSQEYEDGVDPVEPGTPVDTGAIAVEFAPAAHIEPVRRESLRRDSFVRRDSEAKTPEAASGAVNGALPSLRETHSRKMGDRQSSNSKKLRRNGSSSDGTPKNRSRRLASPSSKAKEAAQVVPSKALIEKEERGQGAVGLDVYLNYFSGGERTWSGGALLVFVVLLFVASQVARVACDYFLSMWSAKQQYVDRSTTFWITVYFIIVGITLVLSTVRSFHFANVALRSSRRLHDIAFRLLLASSIPQYFDVTPLGRILNRFSKDLDQLDSLLPVMLFQFAQNSFTLIGVIAICVSGSYYMLALFVPIAGAFFAIQRFFRNSQRELKRIENTSRSPIFSSFAETLSGLSVIRAYDVGAEFSVRNRWIVEQNSKVYQMLWLTQRWLALRLDWVSLLVVIAVCLLAVGLRSSISVGIASLALVYSLQFTGLLQITVRNSVDAENYLTSVERLLSFTSVPAEAPAIIPGHIPPPSWPEQGLIVFKDLQLRYRPELPLVLKGVSCDIKPQEKIGICGRTGSGKSSLMVALFRLVEPSGGSITIDGVDIASIGLESLRSKLSIIPQDPVMFSADVRYNVDPFHLCSDEEIFQVLERVHLAELVRGFETGLAHPVSENGSNFSQGQRQLICIARALLRKSKIIILDEATSSVDAETDALIQRTIRENFAHATVLTIAHRLETIVDSDRILLLSDGKLCEFDSPYRLLSEPTQFRALVAEGGESNLVRLQGLAREADNQRRTKRGSVLQAAPPTRKRNSTVARKSGEHAKPTGLSPRPSPAPEIEMQPTQARNASGVQASDARS